MKEAGDVSLEDVVEVVVRVSDVVEGVHSSEGVLLVEGGEGDQSAVVWESSTFLIPIFVLADPQAAGSGDRGGGSGEDPVLQDSSERPKKKTTRKQDLPDGAPRYGPQTPEFYASMLRNSGRRREPRRQKEGNLHCTTTIADDAGPPPLASKPAKRAGKTGPKT